ncbi:MAG: porin family protein, partial [Candidatus Aminicenantes bacterium]|nr:porin family protein [Candidatus Aminicenantes bacterium]
MKKLTIVLVIAAVIGLLALPQPAAAGVQFGIKAGGNMAKPTGSDVDDIEGTLKTKVGFVGGIFISFNLSKSFYIQTEVLYTMKGATYEYTDVDETVQETLYGDYIEIPLLLKLKFLSSGIQPFIFAGPYVGFKLSEKLEVMGEP